ncbi:MAG: hypothetical protein IT320_00130 [Anaerolineae bacterium]|nr:hypothetical protein [Anaerolineae bacterium]
MRRRAINRFLLTAVLLGAISARVFAHGEATLVVTPTTVSPNSVIRVSGQEVEDGEVFVVTLESTTFIVTLGTVTVEGEDFEQEFTIPDHVPAGTYQVRATTAEGEVISAELTVEAGAGAESVAVEPSAALMELDRSKPIGQILAIAAVLLVSAGIGILLVRSKESPVSADQA